MTTAPILTFPRQVSRGHFNEIIFCTWSKASDLSKTHDFAVKETEYRPFLWSAVCSVVFCQSARINLYASKAAQNFMFGDHAKDCKALLSRLQYAAVKFSAGGVAIAEDERKNELENLHQILVSLLPYLDRWKEYQEPANLIKVLESSILFFAN